MWWKYATVLFAALAVLFVATTAVRADSAWVDELSNSIGFYKINYPGSNWEPYQEKLVHVRDAIGRGDQRTVKVEMGKWFKMLRNRDHGVNDVAADELFNFGLMVTPIQEYGIAVPTPPGGGSDFSY